MRVEHANPARLEHDRRAAEAVTERREWQLGEQQLVDLGATHRGPVDGEPRVVLDRGVEVAGAEQIRQHQDRGVGDDRGDGEGAAMALHVEVRCAQHEVADATCERAEDRDALGA